MSSNLQQRPTKRLPQLEREKEKLETELQALIEEIGNTAKENNQKQKELLSRRDNIEEKAKLMMERIESLDNVAIKEIQQMTMSENYVTRYLKNALTILICAGIIYFVISQLTQHSL